MTQEADTHLDWVLAELRRLEPRASDAEPSWFTGMEAHAADASAALHDALEQGHAEKGLELAVLMARYWWVLGCRSEGRTWLSTFLERVKEARAELKVRAQGWLLELAGEDDSV